MSKEKSSVTLTKEKAEEYTTRRKAVKRERERERAAAAVSATQRGERREDHV